MGKAALLITFGAALFVAQGLLSQTETERYTAQNQGDFENGVVAREIARSGFNVAMGILRDNGNDLHGAIKAINIHGNGKKYLEGEHQGGTFRVQAELVTGEMVRLTSVGYIGGEFYQLRGNQEPEAGWCRDQDPFSREYYSGSCHTLSDSPIYEYELPSGDPLTAKLECGKLEVQFIDSMAGYCSAIYLERTLPLGITEGEDPNAGTPEPAEMLFIPGNNRNGLRSTVSKYVRGGTQMNFFIGVDMNCSTRATSTSVEGYPQFTGSIASPAPYDHLHYALQEEIGKLGDMSETVWAFTEMHPESLNEDEATGLITQRWRIGWEDQHRTAWDNPNSNDPRNSLQALKSQGYEGLGWTQVDGRGYRKLEDFGDRPDFSDQVIEVKLVEESDVSLCYPPAEEETPESEPPVTEEPEAEPPVTEEPEVDPEAEPEPEPCACPRNGNNSKKVLIWHQQGGGNGQEICVSENAVGNEGLSKHLKHDNDHIICRGS
jgi:hypothetical protein